MTVTTSSLRSAIHAIATDVDPMGNTLNALDALLGDGDLGVTVVNGFNNMALVADALPDDFGKACMESAKAMTKVSGSSFGTLMGISLMAVAKQTKGQTDVAWTGLPDLLQAAMDAMIARGGASLGDKTMLDSMAVIIGATRTVDGPKQMLNAAQVAATQALDDFRDRPCKIGRARIFGDKTIGMDDPGMVAIKMMLDRVGEPASNTIRSNIRMIAAKAIQSCALPCTGYLVRTGHSLESRIVDVVFRACRPRKRKKRPRRDAFLKRSNVAYASDGSISLHAATSPLTASTDLSNIACSSLFILISTTRSMPPAPMIVGTPT